MAVGVLCYMVIILGASLVWFERKRYRVYMPVKPDTVAGCMYYLAGSRMVGDFEGLVVVDSRGRGRAVREMGRGRGYVFGEVGEGGRVGVDYMYWVGGRRGVKG